MDFASRIYVAGGDTLIGAALLERLVQAGYRNLVGVPPQEPDLTDAGQVEDFFSEARPEFVFVAAGRSGGIRANQIWPAELMLHNLLVASHVISAAYQHGVTRLLYLGSSCSYPKQAAQPMGVSELMTGALEPTSEAYATAKLAGLKLCQAYRRQYGAPFLCAIPGDSFGPGDDFSAEGSHVIPALIRKMHEAKKQGQAVLTLWGTGTPRREFLYARDLTDACLFVMRSYDEPEPINLGGGTELAIAEAAAIIATVVGYRGQIRFDASKPDGMPRKALDSSRLRALGWKPATDFRSAVVETYQWFLGNVVREGRPRVREAV